MLFDFIEFVGLIEDLPSDVPMNLLSRFLILLLGHRLSSGILVPPGCLKLSVEVLIHLIGLLLESLHDTSVSMVN
jgi:hypothetical protein